MLQFIAIVQWMKPREKRVTICKRIFKPKQITSELDGKLDR